MAYDYTCDAGVADDCALAGDVPALAGQFREQPWLTQEFGGIMQNADYQLNDTITICPACTLRILTEFR